MSDALPRWKQLLDQALAEPGATATTVSSRLGVSSSYVRRAASDNFAQGVPDKFQRRVLEKLDTVLCPHLVRDLTLDDCRTYASRACPTSSVREVRHWKACQTCPNKPEGK